MKHHPEQQDDEVYMGNTTIEYVGESFWRTSRLGGVSYGSDGKLLSDCPSLRPWFIKAAEVARVIQTEKKKMTPRSEELVEILQPLLDQRTIFTK